MLHHFTFAELYALFLQLPVWVFVVLCIIVFMGVVGQWTLYSKCDLPGYSSIVPIWNVIMFLKIVGRPSSQSWIVIVPPLIILLSLLFIDHLTIALIISSICFLPWAYYVIRVYIEICNCFGKYSTISYILIVVFNGIYLFNLALSQDEKYRGPVYQKS